MQRLLRRYRYDRLNTFVIPPLTIHPPRIHELVPVPHRTILSQATIEEVHQAIMGSLPRPKPEPKVYARRRINGRTVKAECRCALCGESVMTDAQRFERKEENIRRMREPDFDVRGKLTYGFAMAVVKGDDAMPNWDTKAMQEGRPFAT